MSIKALGLIVCLGLLAPIASPARTKSNTPQLMTGLGDVHHPVSTSNQKAQQFFDQGLKLVYAFNHDEARRSFQRAAELDPKLAMAYWGVALAVGPNYNAAADAQQWKTAFEAIQQAGKLAAQASEPENAYIQAL